VPQYTIISTSAAQGSDAAEVSSLADEFVNESEVLGYSRRMAEEMLALAGQLALDFDYTNVGVYEGDLIDEDPVPTHPTFVGAWFLDEDGVAFVTAEEFHREAADLAAS
jgi:hypothetical protein